MKNRKHRVLDHPIIGYFLLIVFVLLLTSLGSLIDSPISSFVSGIAGHEVGSGIGTAIGAVMALAIFWIWFKPDFDGCLKKKGFLAGIIMLLPVLVIHYAGSIVSWTALGTGSVLSAFLLSFAPGFGEEVMFRGLGIANYMRTIRSEKQIKVIFWLSSVVFGLVHATNIFAGGDPFAVGVQTVYAIGIGMALGAVYLRTGNLWPCILGHRSLDFTEFIRGDLAGSDGVMVGMGVGDWITVVAAAVGAVLGLLMIRQKNCPQIMEVWSRKW